MARGKAGEENVRTLYKSGGVSYSLTLPISGIRALGWQEGQRVVVELDEKNKRFSIRDWER
ncbi:MAG: hypothetical protein WD049_00715 [Candidatus Paceibacterota bacterium]